MRKKKKSLLIIGVILLLLIVVRLMLPYWIENYINNMLDEIPNHTGSVTDVDLHLYRGAYAIDSLKIFQENVSLETPFFSTDKIDLSIEWSSLFKGSVVGEMELMHPKLNFLVYQAGDSTGVLSGKGADWTEPIKELLPIRINRMAGIDGRIHYIDTTTDPKVNIYLNNLNFEATNISNVEGKESLPSTISATAGSIGGGSFSLNSDINLLKEIPDLDMELTFEGASLPALNDFTKAYSKLDAHEGVFNLYSEMAVNEGKIEGYVKPVLTDIKIVDISEDKDKPLKLLWESVAGFIIEIFENQPKDQFATQVPLSGDLNKIETAVWPTLANIFKNAFIEAFSKKTEDEVSFEDVTEDN